MGAFLFLLLLSALNVGFGYALAVLLGYGPRRLQDAWLALGSEGRPPRLSTTLDNDFVATPEDTRYGQQPASSAAALSPSGPGGNRFDPIAEYGGGAT